MTDYISIFVHIILLISFLAYPYMSKRDVAFGIKIPTSANEDEDVLKIRKQFLGLTALAGITFIIIQLINNSETVLMISMFISIVVYVLIYVMAYKLMKSLKSEKQWKVAPNTTIIDTKFRNRKLIVSSKWYLLYALVVVLSGVVSILKFDELPDMLRIQVNSIGEVTSTMPKDKAILYLIGTQIIVMLLMVFVQVIIKKAKQDISSQDTEQSIKNNVSFRFMISIILYVLGLIVGVVMFMALLFSFEIIKNENTFVITTLVLTFVPVIVLIAYSVKAGQDGSRLSDVSSDVIEKDDDELWKLGLIYYNPNDPAIFVSKRVGVGWSLNHARWQTWAMIVVIITFVVISILLSK